jgi:hypothetical protein
LDEALDRFALELTLEQSAAGRVHEEFVRLLIQLAFLGTRARATREADPLLEVRQRLERGSLDGVSPRPGGSRGTTAWQALLKVVADADWSVWEGPSGVDTIGRHGFSEDAVRALLRWLDRFVPRATLGLDGLVREIGALHELSLSVRFERLSSRGRRLRKSRAWLEPARVLAWEPGLRAKRLQGELGLSKHSVQQLGPVLSQLTTSEAIEGALLSVFDLEHPARAAGQWVVQPSLDQRRRGAHYTPWALCLALVERTLAPLIARLPEPRSRSLLELQLCDPAVGAGAFLIAVTHHLSQVLADAWEAEGDPSGTVEGADRIQSARRRIASAVVHGVDKNPTAVTLSRLTLAAFALGPADSPRALCQRLRRGDALVGRNASGGDREPMSRAAGLDPFDWPAAFPAVFERQNPGFDAIVGNPPWVAYVGRASQPLQPALFAYYQATNPAFARYRTLHGLFVYRSATLLREGGRLGLVLPTSVADLDGYRATRDAHDALCDVDERLPDWGDGAFSGVFQPSMALLSTRRAAGTLRSSGICSLAEQDLGTVARSLLERLRSLPTFPPELFGERGFQTHRDDQAHLRRASEPLSTFDQPLREGADISEFCRLEPGLFADPRRLSGRLRPPADWTKVALLIRQTARYPIAALADGVAFRNSILACFEDEKWKASLLSCFLNSGLARWFHYNRHRDARQGMPQLKVGHLRALPALPSEHELAWQALDGLGAELGKRNRGIAVAERDRLNDLVYRAFGLDGSEREVVEAWASANPPPVSRRRAPAALEEARPANLPPE